MGLPMALLCPKAPFLAVPENVIEFKLSTPIAFAAEAIVELAFCASTLIERKVAISMAPMILMVRIMVLQFVSLNCRAWSAAVSYGDRPRPDTLCREPAVRTLRTAG